jgi:hypothetical protein
MAGEPWGVAGYAILLSLITAFAVWCGPETYRSDINAEENGTVSSSPRSSPLLLRSA